MIEQFSNSPVQRRGPGLIMRLLNKLYDAKHPRTEKPRPVVPSSYDGDEAVAEYTQTSREMGQEPSIPRRGESGMPSPASGAQSSKPETPEDRRARLRLVQPPEQVDEPTFKVADRPSLADAARRANEQRPPAPK